MPPRYACACAGNTHTSERNTQLESRQRADGISSQLRDMIAAKLPGDVPEADREVVLARITKIAAAAQSSLIEVAIDIGLGNPASPRIKGCIHMDFSDSPRTSVHPEERVAYRIEEVVAVTGVSRATVRKHIGTDIKARKVGGTVLLDPEDVHRTFGFMIVDSVAPSREALAEIEELLQ
jgi:hypothetical protein